MTPRELAGAINRASAVWCWVDYGTEGEGMYVQVTKSSAKSIVAEARTQSVEDIFAEKSKSGLKIGAPLEEDGETVGSDEEE